MLTIPPDHLGLDYLLNEARKRNLKVQLRHAIIAF